MSAGELHHAIELARSGQKADARLLLLKIVRAEPRNELAWMWLIETLESDADRAATLQYYLTINPNSAFAARALTAFRRTIPTDKPAPAQAETSPKALVQPPREGIRPASDEAVPPASPVLVSPTIPSQPAEEASQSSPAEMITADQPESKPSSITSRLIEQTTVEAAPSSSTSDETAEITEALWLLSEPEEPAPVKTNPFRESQSAAIEEDLVNHLRETVEPIPSAASAGATRPSSAAPTVPAKRASRILRKVLLLANATLLLGIVVVALLIFTGRVQLSAMGGNDSAAQATLSSLQSEKQQLETLAAQQSTSGPSDGDLVSAPTLAGRPMPLPAPVYFLSLRSGISQVWRLEADGQTLTQMTRFSAPVTDFDVSPTSGSLAIVSGNRLYLTGKDGGNIRTLTSGEELPEGTDLVHSPLAISSPRWSPDGQQIAFAFNGLQIFSMSGAKIRLLAPNDPPLEGSTEPLTYFPRSWSPDGSLLLATQRDGLCSRLAIFPMDGRPALKNLGHDGATTSWSSDGQFFYAAVPVSGCQCDEGNGLWRVHTTSGEEEKLIDVEGLQDYSYTGWVQEAGADRIAYFIGKWKGEYCSNMPETVPMAMVLSNLSDPSLRDFLRSDRLPLSEVLWSPGLDLAVAVHGQTGELVVLSTHDAPVYSPGIRSRELRWGPMPGSGAQPVAELQPVPTTVPIPALEFWQIALNENDLPPGAYTLLRTTTPQTGKNVRQSLEVVYLLDSPPLRRIFTHELTRFVNNDLAAAYLQKAQESNLPEVVTLPSPVGDETSASAETRKEGEVEVYRFRLAWRNGSSVSILSLDVSGGTPITLDEMTDLAKRIQARIAAQTE